MSKKKRRANETGKNALFAYTDESGNTGENLFDETQPFFWTGTVLSVRDLESVGSKQVKDWTSTLGVSELHGKDLGITGMEKIAPALEALLKQADARFLFTRIEKEHIANTRLCEMLLDSDFNKAVSPVHDLSRLYRRMLTVIVAKQLYRSDRRNFWLAYQSGDVKKFCLVLDNLQLRIKERVRDERPKQLLLDAISWALKHPDIILRPKRPASEPLNLDSPNVLTVVHLTDGLHQFAQKMNARVVRLVHDTQKQFGKAIKETFEVAKGVMLPKGSILFERIRTIPCSLELVASHASVGLQIVDLCLWLAVRFFKYRKLPDSNPCQSLWDCIARRAIIKQYTFDQLESETQTEIAEVMTKAFPPEKEARVRRFMEEHERRRVQRMNSPLEE